MKRHRLIGCLANSNSNRSKICGILYEGFPGTFVEDTDCFQGEDLMMYERYQQ
jgi:hypothetical protein